MTSSETDRTAGYKLIHDGVLVAFDVVGTRITDAVGGDEKLVRIDLQLGEIEDDEEEGERTHDEEWGGLGFIFCLANLSFADARPRGVSGMHYEDEDELSVGDLLAHLRYVRGELRFSADYIRGRCMKTDITIRPNGTATLETRCRGEAATRWLARMKGKKLVEAVGEGAAAPS